MPLLLAVLTTLVMFYVLNERKKRRLALARASNRPRRNRRAIPVDDRGW
jgi:hypothetical protein